MPPDIPKWSALPLAMNKLRTSFQQPTSSFIGEEWKDCACHSTDYAVVHLRQHSFVNTVGWHL